MYSITIITGNLGNDPQMRYTPGGSPVTNFSVAVNKQYTNNAGDTVKKTVWYAVSAFGKLAEVCNQYLAKGRQVLVEGELIANETGNPRVYQRNDGAWAASYELKAQTVKFLSKNGAAEAAQHASTEDNAIAVEAGDGLPF